MNAWMRIFFFAVAGLAWATVCRATSVIPPDFAQLVNESDYVIRGVVTSVTSEFQTTPGGGRKIITKVAVDVSEVLAGSPPAKVVLEMLGGTVGNETMRVAGAPQFKAGDEDILFVKDNGKTINPLFAMMHGRYPIMHEAGTGREYVARSNRMPLQSTADVARPMGEGTAADLQLRLSKSSTALTPEEFAREVKAAVNPHYVAKQLY